MSVVGGQPKRHADPSYKATKHIEPTFLISNYYREPVAHLVENRAAMREVASSTPAGPSLRVLK